MDWYPKGKKNVDWCFSTTARTVFRHAQPSKIHCVNIILHGFKNKRRLPIQREIRQASRQSEGPMSSGSLKTESLFIY